MIFWVLASFHSRDYPYDPALYSFQMEGLKLLRSAKKELPRFLETFFTAAPIRLDQVDWLIPHQASKLGLRILSELNGGKSANIIHLLARYGNCISASIPLGLVCAIEEGKITENDTCFLIGTAAGISMNGLLLKYTAL